MRSSRLVAESLRLVPEPVATAIPRLEPVSAAGFRAAVAAIREPARYRGTPPSFLRPPQVDPWRRAMAALAGWHAAVLAEPVGSGKTWIALAVAAREQRPCTVIGPAALADQWRLAASRAAVPIRWHSLERLSRGRVPPGAPLVIVDEAHRLRHRDTRRVTTLAPWLLGRRILMLTATPIVNRRSDLIALLALGVADDALILDGIPSLGELARRRVPPPAMRRLVIRSGSSGLKLPQRDRRLRITGAERRRTDRIVTAVATMRLGDDPGLRQLLATVLLDAGSSSDAAWHAALRRYRLLLHHARDAGGASRTALRRLIGPALDQMVLWPLMGEIAAGTRLPSEDLPAVDAALALPPDDAGWIVPLRHVLADRRVTACFCRHRATARALATALGEDTAWVTGGAAGIGHHRITRGALLMAFGPDRRRWQLRRQQPTVLVATEVLAEGLDLQGASRVVHVDLPWHPARLEQRTGRVRRLGQLAPSVEVVNRPVPRTIEQALGMRRRIRRKGGTIERWLTALAAAPATAEPPGIVAVFAGTRFERQAGMAWIELAAADRSGCIAIATDRRGRARTLAPIDPPGLIGMAAPGDRARAADLAARAVRHALSQARSPRPARRALVARILALARRCAAEHRGEALVRLDRLLMLATAAGPLGLDLLLDRLHAADDATLLAAPIPALAGGQPPQRRRLAVLLDHGPRAGLP